MTIMTTNHSYCEQNSLRGKKSRSWLQLPYRKDNKITRHRKAEPHFMKVIVSSSERKYECENERLNFKKKQKTKADNYNAEKYFVKKTLQLTSYYFSCKIEQKEPSGSWRVWMTKKERKMIHLQRLKKIYHLKALWCSRIY